MKLGYCIITILVGGLIPLQAAVNSQLRNWLGSAMHATLASLIVSIITVAVYMCIFREPFAPFKVIASVPAWAWAGGVCGVVYLFTVIVMAPRLGSASLIACIMGGQVLCSVILDHFGWIGFQVHPISMGRLAGAVLLMLGIGLVLRC